MSTRFGSVGLIAGAMASALAFYMVSLRVAAERSDVERIRRTIAADLRDIRALEAELRTRARLPQLQRWNDEVLAMSAPTSKQFANGAIALVAYAPNAGDAVVPRAPDMQLAVATNPVVAAPTVRTVAYEVQLKPTAAPKPVAAVKADVEAPAKPAAQPAKPEPMPLTRVAATRPLGLSNELVLQIETAAAAERATFRKVSMQ